MARSKSRKSDILNRLAFLVFFLVVVAVFLAVLIGMLIMSEGPNLKGDPVTHSGITAPPA